MQTLLPFVAGSDTSRQASATARERAATIRARLLAYFVECGPAGATDEQAQFALGSKCQTETPRRGELVRLGLVRDSGQRRPTSSGRPAAVWVATTAAGALDELGTMKRNQPR